MIKLTIDHKIAYLYDTYLYLILIRNVQMKKMVQAPNTILMVRPGVFYPNPDTVACNSFQSKQLKAACHAELLADVQTEFDVTVDTLRSVGIDVRVVQDSADPPKPDAVFPNNWFSTHSDGTIAIYPMYSHSRRHERCMLPQIKEQLCEDFIINKTLDYSHHEQKALFLEGTGSICIDHESDTAYIGISNRAEVELAQEVCAALGLEPVLFNTADAKGNPVYHTNVMLCVGTGFALVGTEMIPDLTERKVLLQRLEQSGNTVIELSGKQIAEFAGNAIELTGNAGHYLAMSQRGADSLTISQKYKIERYAALLSVPLPTVELSGGSMRCMIAGIHLPRV